MSFGVRTGTGMAGGSTQGKQREEAGDVCLLWESGSVDQPPRSSVLWLRRAPGLKPGAGSPTLFRGSCALAQDA